MRKETNFVSANPQNGIIEFCRGDATMMTASARLHGRAVRETNDQPCCMGEQSAKRRTTSPGIVEELAFTHWQVSANEKAYEAKLITKAMYEYARDELHKTIERLSEARYDNLQRQKQVL